MEHAIAWALDAQVKGRDGHPLIGQHFVAIGDLISVAKRLPAAREALQAAHGALSECDTMSNHGSIERCPCSTAGAYRSTGWR